ncbi:MAG: hypothetical protein ACE366_08180 [Bradymonadia bacterium]
MSRRTPLILFLVALGVFCAFANVRLRIHSQDNHFVYLADAFLNGSTELQRKPPHGNDWASYKVQQLKGASAEKYGSEVKGFFTRRKGKGNEFRTLAGDHIEIPRADRGAAETKHFVSFPPMPAILMLPSVAAIGYGTNDVIFTVIFAALNFVLAWLVLRQLRHRGHSDRSDSDHIWLAALLTFGSAHLWCGVMGKVWFTALVVGVTFNLLYIWWAIDARKPLLAGIALACGFATRASLVFGAVFFYLQLWQRWSKQDADRRSIIRDFALFSAPCLVVGVALMAYNYARFENPLEFGHTYLAGGHLARIRDFGLFHPEFINRNLTAAFTLMPKFTDHAPYVQLSKHGMALWVSMPAIVYVLWPQRRHPLAQVAGITAVVILVPLLLYQNTGWIQFSYRFALDFLPYLLVCLALGGRPLTRTFKALIVVSVLVNALGAVTFQRKIGNGLYAEFMTEEPRR